jgi:hypothetical protein
MMIEANLIVEGCLIIKNFNRNPSSTKGGDYCSFAFIQQSLPLNQILGGDDDNLPINLDAFNY